MISESPHAPSAHDPGHRQSEARETDRKAVRLALLVAAIAVISWAATAFGGEGSPQPIVRIEEDWVVEIGEPDPTGCAPQVITAMSSTDQLADVHCVFEINHTNFPRYTAGGMELQIWSGDQLLDYRLHPKTGVCATPNEVIKYTTSMKLTGSAIEFEVKNGSSTTWGNFGRVGWFRCSVPTSQTAFTRYSPDVSVENSYVGYASHRVKKVVLKEVRYYSPSGLVHTTSGERIVHELVPEDGVGL